MITLHDKEVYLGQAKLLGSRVGIGTWAIGGGWGPQPEEQSLAAILRALELGCALIDTAPLYGNGHAERIVARAFREYGTRVTTLTKIYPLDYHWSPAPGTAIEALYPREHIIAQAEESLRRLETDCLDCLLFQTWCPTWTHQGEWLETMRLLQQQGKIRTFGISVSDHRAADANAIIRAGCVDIIEVPYSILDQRAAHVLFPLAQEHQVSIIARSPLASGALTGKWHDGMKFHRRDWRRRVFRDSLLTQTVQRVEKVKALIDPSQPLAQIALRYCLSHPAVTAVIPGVRTTEQSACDLAVQGHDLLSPDIIASVTELWNEEFHHNVRTSVGDEKEG